MYKLKHLTIAISLAFASITAPYGVFAAENAVATAANQGAEQSLLAIYHQALTHDATLASALSEMCIRDRLSAHGHSTCTSRLCAVCDFKQRLKDA